MSNHHLDKVALRKQFIEKRRAMASQNSQASFSLAQQLIQQSFFKESAHIACYLSHRHEMDTRVIIEAIWQHRKKCYLPRLNQQAQTLIFAQYHPQDPLIPNHLAILEPVSMAPTIEPTQIDLVLLPLVAFDSAGHRLGMGGGYYDRTFAFCKTKTTIHPLLIGLAYDAQQAVHLPYDLWDVPLDGVITETRYHSI